MQRVEIRDLHKIYKEYENKEITICGWARTIRDSKNIAFVEINDGAFKSVQIVVEREKVNNYDEIVKQNIEKFRKRLLEYWEELPPDFLSSAKNKIGKEEICNYIEEINNQYTK